MTSLLSPNYRPISLLPILSKTLERVVRKQLVQHLTDNHLLYPLQSGFRSGHSTTTALLHCTNDWYTALDRGLLVGVLFLDVSKAFDTVDHSLLVRKLSTLGVAPQGCKWMESYLEHRTQSTLVGSSVSDPLTLPSGVPQGSVLGPALFSLFVNDLPEAITGATTLLFADDTTIYAIGKDVASIAESLTSALHLANKWLCDNHLSLNVQKTKTMLIHSARRVNLPPLSVHLLSAPVEQVYTTKFLGVCIKDTLVWHEHVRYVRSTVSRNLNLLRRLSWFLPKAALLVFYHSYIVPTFDYCDVVWGCCTKEDALSLERLQNFAARAILRQRRWYSAGSARRELSLSTLSSRRDFHLAQHCYKAIRGHHPQYLKSLFTLSSATHGHRTRQASTGSAHLPLPKTNFGKKAFSYRGAAIWNSLPTTARDASTISAFNSIINPFLLTTQLTPTA